MCISFRSKVVVWLVPMVNTSVLQFTVQLICCTALQNIEIGSFGQRTQLPSWVNGCVIQKRKNHFYRMMTQVGQAVVQTSTDFVPPKDNFWETRNWLFFQHSDSSIKSFEVLIIWLIDFEVFQNFFILFSTTLVRWVFLKIHVRSLAKGHT